jgi:hypothetical protein
MAFEIKSIDPKLFAEIYTPAVAKELDQHIYASRNWIDDVSGRKWAIDEARRACFIKVHMADRMHSTLCYALVWHEGVALIDQVAFCKYRLVYWSPSFSVELEEVKVMMREALRVGGELLNGVSDQSDSFAVPHAEFFDK